MTHRDLIGKDRSPCSVQVFLELFNPTLHNQERAPSKSTNLRVCFLQSKCKQSSTIRRAREKRRNVCVYEKQQQHKTNINNACWIGWNNFPFVHTIKAHQKKNDDDPTNTHVEGGKQKRVIKIVVKEKGGKAGCLLLVYLQVVKLVEIYYDFILTLNVEFLIFIKTLSFS